MPGKEANGALGSSPRPRGTRLSYAANLRRILLLHTLQPVSPEQLHLPSIEPHIQSHVIWMPKTMFYRAEHPPKLGPPVGLRDPHPRPNEGFARFQEAHPRIR